MSERTIEICSFDEIYFVSSPQVQVMAPGIPPQHPPSASTGESMQMLMMNQMMMQQMAAQQMQAAQLAAMAPGGTGARGCSTNGRNHLGSVNIQSELPQLSPTVVNLEWRLPSWTEAKA